MSLIQTDKTVGRDGGDRPNTACHLLGGHVPSLPTGCHSGAAPWPRRARRVSFGLSREIVIGSQPTTRRRSAADDHVLGVSPLSFGRVISVERECLMFTALTFSYFLKVFSSHGEAFDLLPPILLPHYNNMRF